MGVNFAFHQLTCGSNMAIHGYSRMTSCSDVQDEELHLLVDIISVNIQINIMGYIPHFILSVIYVEWSFC